MCTVRVGNHIYGHMLNLFTKHQPEGDAFNKDIGKELNETGKIFIDDFEERIKLCPVSIDLGLEETD